MRYVIVIENGQTSYDAYVPNRPGGVVIGETLAEVRTLIQAAIDFHLEGLKQDGYLVPEPVSICEYVEAS
jgi:predicted RNase H-like HicB family nuclease